MAKNKTTQNENSVTVYLNAIADEQKRKDCTAIAELIHKQTGLEPKMWGTGIIGFGTYHYKYESGREGDAPLVGFASRANAIVLYLHMAADNDKKEKLLKELGKYKTGKGCVYIQKLADINTPALGKIVQLAVDAMKRKYPD